MRQICSILLAASSLLWPVLSVAAARPHYGGTLHVAVKETPAAFDPVTLAANGPAGLSRLVFDTLVKLDERGRPQPALAASWQAEPGNQRWRFLLGSGVSFHDGAILDANSVAASLRAGNPNWKIVPAGDTLIIETDTPDPQLPAELALERNGILRRANGKVSGAGPFSIDRWDASTQRLTLKANEQYWHGRPFLDSVEIDFGKSYRDQLTLLDLGKANVIEIAPENIHRAQADGRTVMNSEPSRLLVLIFAGDAKSEDEVHARNALAMSIDTAAINNVVLQSGGVPTGTLLPNWATGYAFAFPLGGDSENARQERTKARHLPSWTLGYDATDPISRVIADRILLNARDVGITLQLVSFGATDLRLMRIPLASEDPYVALTEFSKTLQLPEPKFKNSSVSALYSAEYTLLQTHRIIPLLHLRSAVAVRTNVHDLSILPGGELRLDNAWLSQEKP
jgi:peptide/nickel transport system substrate-binding protein